MEAELPRGASLAAQEVEKGEEAALLHLDAPRIAPAPEVAPQPQQLSVLHVQREASSAREGLENLTVVLPDGTKLGSQFGGAVAVAAAPTVVLLPGARMPARMPARAEEQPGALPSALPFRPPMSQPPAENESQRARMLSVSQRLSALLGPEPPPEQLRPGKLQPASRQPAVAAAGKAPALLRRAKGSVLARMDELTTAILEHIFDDTARLLNKQDGCFQAASSTASEPEETSRVRLQPASAGGVSSGSPQLTLAHTAFEDSQVELARLEAKLNRKYIVGEAPGSNDQQRSLEFTSADQATGLLPADGMAGGGPLLGSWGVCVQRFFAGSDGHVAEALEEKEAREEMCSLSPAALPLERVQEIEHYRIRFAHHCKVAREAGIDTLPDGRVASTATWLIWPYLADSIAMSAVGEAIEETHEAMERHVDELVCHEVGGIG